MTTKTPQMRMLSDRLLVRPADIETQTPAGLHIPDVAKEKPLRGTVVAVGEGRARPDGSVKPMRVHVGDEVLYARGTGNTVEFVRGDEMLILREDDVLAVLTPEAAA